jgi:hypothetical protein
MTRTRIRKPRPRRRSAASAAFDGPIVRRQTVPPCVLLDDLEDLLAQIDLALHESHGRR